MQVHPLAGTPSGRYTPMQVHPLAGTPLAGHVSLRLSLQRTVRILLECFLFIILYFHCFVYDFVIVIPCFIDSNMLLIDLSVRFAVVNKRAFLSVCINL